MKSKPRKKIKVMAFGTFDRFHKGHEYYLKNAKNLGGYLIVVIARDQTVKKVKGKLPRQQENDRLNKVFASGLADLAALGRLTDKYAVIRRFKPEVIALGYDQLNFTEKLRRAFPKIKIVRIASHRPEIYKSSKMKIKKI